MRKLLAVALATAAFVSIPAFAASAEEDPNTGTLTYTGTTVTSQDGTTYPASEGPLVLDCVDGRCTSLDSLPDLIFVNGVVESPTTEEYSDADCSFTYTATRDHVLTAETLKGTTIAQASNAVCAGEPTEFTAVTVVADFTYESGDTCLIDASCTVAAGPSTVENAAGLPLSNPGPFLPGGSRPVDTVTEVSSVTTLVEAFTPANILWAAGGTVVLAILIAIPTQFANSAADTVAGNVRERWRRWRKTTETKPAFTGWPWAAGGVLAASVIAALADPNFGFDGAGLRLFLSILATFALEVVVGWFAVVLIVRRTHPTAAVSFQFAPISLLIVVGAVLVSRLSGFEPPIIFGLVAGVAFGGVLGTAERARVTLIGLGWAFGIGILAWVGYSLLPADLVILRELLATAAIAGISALPIALLPLRGLAGHVVWQWKKTVWAAAYAIGLFAFLLVLLPLPGSWSEVGMGLWTWVALFVAYTLAAVGLWLGVTRPWRKAAQPA